MDIYRKIAFIGAGNMAEAMIGAILRAGLRQPEDIVISDTNTERIEKLTRVYGLAAASSNAEAVEASDIVVLAVKPQRIDTVLAELAGAGCFENISSRKLLVSVAAGIPLARVEQFIYAGRSGREMAYMPLIRVMPNTPALVGAGMSGLCANNYATQEDLDAARSIFSSMGEVLVFGEEKMDAVTAVSGSGPAYGFYLIEAMTEAGERLGLAREEASKLARGAISGAVSLIEQTNQDPQDLRSKVTSPGGTTEAAITLLEANQVKDSIIEAVLAAARRSRELSSSNET